MSDNEYVPPWVRYGNRKAKFGWWLRGRRQAAALRLAPWLNSRAQATRARAACRECGGYESHTGYCSQSAMRNPDHPFNKSGDMRDNAR